IGLTCVPFGAEGARMVALSADDSSEFIPPTRENVATRRYPLSRELYFVMQPGRNTAEDLAARELARAALSAERQAVAAVAGFLPLPDETVRTERGKLD